MSSLWDFVWLALFVAVAFGQSEDPFAEFDTEEAVIVESDDYEVLKLYSFLAYVFHDNLF